MCKSTRGWECIFEHTEAYLELLQTFIEGTCFILYHSKTCKQRLTLFLWRFQQWRYFGLAECNTGWHIWSKSQYCPSLKVLQVKTSCFNAHFNSVHMEKVLLGSLIQTSPNIAHVSGDHALIVPAGAATPPHCDNPLHSSSCLKLCPCPFNVSCLAVQSSGQCTVTDEFRIELFYQIDDRPEPSQGTGDSAVTSQSSSKLSFIYGLWLW